MDEIERNADDIDDNAELKARLGIDQRAGRTTLRPDMMIGLFTVFKMGHLRHAFRKNGDGDGDGDQTSAAPGVPAF